MSLKTRAELLTLATALESGTPGNISAAEVRDLFSHLADSALIGETRPNIASASTVDLGAQSSTFLNITGTTPITSFGTIASGLVKFLLFTDALTITHNATSLICPAGTNIVTTPLDLVVAQSIGSGNWRVLGVIRASWSQTSSGLYTPTLTGVTNISAVAFDYVPWMWTRINNVVMVAGNMTIDAGAINTVTQFDMTLPVASNFTNLGHLAGHVTLMGVPGSLGIYAETGGLKARAMGIWGSDHTNAAASVSFTYRVM